ncbi:MAG: glycoside hydrolase family 32 protein [Rhodothermaceae bacterium]|nr:glycoside hydrolase family 32 protein [Rhodothermaceae bacterium]
MKRTIPFAMILGFIVAIYGCKESSQYEVEMNSETVSKTFDEQHRPQFHFSPPQQWMNDPNGMVFYDDEYHLFYQHYPDSNVWGPMHWGHAVSSDMVNWEHLPIGLYPDELGYIFSGSAVVDWNNTSGFGSGTEPPLVAIYTYHEPVRAKDQERVDIQYQGIAYSLDKGRTWTKYEGNPVLDSPGIRDFRDPKVMWYEEGKKWIMTLAVKDKISFYSSPDLKSWSFESDFGEGLGGHGGVWECPDLFKLPVTGADDEKWVLLVSINPGGPAGGSATQYFVGEFDGSTFSLDPSFAPEVIPVDGEEQAVWIDYGPDNYAGVTWSDIPESDGRRLFIGWMSNWKYAQVVPTTVWRSAMTIPRELRLHERAGSYRLSSKPVDEMQGIMDQPVDVFSEIQSELVLEDSLFALDLGGENLEGMQLTLSNNAGEFVSITLNNDHVLFDRSQSGITDFEESFAGSHSAPLEDLIPERVQVFVDLSSIEVFVNDGAVVMTELVFPIRPYNKISLEGNIDSAMMRTVSGIWNTKM